MSEGVQEANLDRREQRAGKSRASKPLDRPTNPKEKEEVIKISQQLKAKGQMALAQKSTRHSKKN